MALLGRLHNDRHHPPCDGCDWMPIDASSICANAEIAEGNPDITATEICLQRLQCLATTLNRSAPDVDDVIDGFCRGHCSPSPSLLDLTARRDLLPELIRILRSLCLSQQPLEEEDEQLACDSHHGHQYPTHNPKPRHPEASASHFSCQRCRRTVTPRRRRGPDGSRTLCNVCGLIYAKRRQRGMHVEPRAELEEGEPAAVPHRREETAPKRQLLEGIASCFNSPLYADLTVYIGETELPAHSLVLASQSAYFNSVLNQESLDGSAQTLYLETDKPHAYWRVFQYMYRGNYSEDSCPAPVPDDDSLTKDLQVYLLANILQVDRLMEYALARFRAKFERLGTAEALAYTSEIMSRVASKSF